MEVKARTSSVGIALIGTLVICGCATKRPPEIPLDEPVAATRLPETAMPVQIVEVPKLLPLPGQLKPVPAIRVAAPETTDPKDRVTRANQNARVQPSRDNYLNATQVWPYSPDALYQIYASPEEITDVALESGEELVSVSAGDTVRWVIGDTTSGAGSSQRVHILVKPTRPDLKTNLVINSNRRTYHLELTATPDTWMASVSWEYPLDQLAMIKGANVRAESTSPVAEGIAVERLNFRYEISGGTPSWRPLRAFDDGAKVYVQFPAGIAQGEMPPLFIVGAGDKSELVNYRVRSPYYIVDRLFGAAELRLGGKDAQVVRISRTDAAGRAADKGGGR
jgi:P-type conjugative transfer protein TrbG